ncbi:MAG: GIY-YIG nuclease family protein, partial [Dehalococcoidia bacterium]|nr:GIY-YIG nuclease family protein [Dehalococcoidia bacterium]
QSTSGERPSRAGGAYALLFYLAREVEIEVGRLGRFSFAAGWYLYLGSAMGGLKARLGRHLEGPRRLHWHVDYLARQADLVEVWWRPANRREECSWASLALAAPDARLPVAGFGSSDCRCASHLAYFPKRPTVEILESEGISTLQAGDPVHNQ